LDRNSSSSIHVAKSAFECRSTLGYGRVSKGIYCPLFEITSTHALHQKKKKEKRTPTLTKAKEKRAKEKRTPALIA
jgi:hypothetical protein